MFKLNEIAKLFSISQEFEDQTIKNISIDTRTMQAGDLYIAIKGDTFDGHDFLHDAKRKGAIAVIVSHHINIGIPQIIYEDTTIALGKLAKYHRAKFSLPIVAITGSSGKTTVKEMISSICKIKGNINYTKGNLNNAIGVPLTLLNLKDTDRFSVIELGANHIGEISYTTSLTNPNIALINNISYAHIEGFGSIEGVAQAKSEIFENSPNHSTAILNLDIPFQDVLLTAIGNKQTLTYSMIKEADIWVDFINETPTGNLQFCLHTKNNSINITLPLIGKHNIENALAAAACAHALNIPLRTIQEGLENTPIIPGRMIVKKGKNGAFIIDDTYNANPLSVKAALDYLASRKGHRYFVFGDMVELGPNSAIYHQEMGNFANDANIDTLFTCGSLCQHIHTTFNGHGVHFSSQEALIHKIKPMLKQNDYILVKGSRSAKMENIVLALC